MFELGAPEGMCSPNPYYPGGRYLVGLVPHEGKLRDGICFQGRDLKYLGEDIQRVRNYFAGRKPILMRGTVAAAPQESVDYLLRTGHARPLSGVTISAVGRQSHTTTTDAEGRYNLPLPGAGTYQIKATFAPYEAKLVSKQLRGCEVLDFGLTTNNTISGKVRDQNGQRLKDVRVGLIDLDQPHSSSRKPWISESTSGPDLTFTFKNVPAVSISVERI
jgi:hypothetical protein